MSSTIEWWTNKIRYDAGDLGYVMLQLPHFALPALKYRGVNFEPKQELHCSLLCIPKVVALANEPALEVPVRQFVKDFVKSHSIQFQAFGEQLYMCEYEGVRSIVVTALVSGASDLFAGLRANFSQLGNLPEPSLHVTLYKYNHRYGIGIQNDKEREQLCRLVPETELTEVRKVVHE